MKMRFIVCLSLCLIGSITSGEVMSSISSDVLRHLQSNQTLNYRATYLADFQHLHDFDCMADKPVLQLSCYGLNMTILSVSDPSINCTQLENSIVKSGTTFTCVNTCVDCRSVYEASGNIIEGPFASIEFICEGDDIQHIDALYTYDNGNPGSCSATTSTTSRNYHVGRLGVSCPTTGTSREFVYDDTYVECVFSISDAPGFITDITPEMQDVDTYTCISGDNCNGATCTVPFDEISFYTQARNFIDTCVNSLVAIDTTPTQAPQVFTTSTRYKVQYESSWGQLYSSEASRDSCTSTNPSIAIQCEAGSSIGFINSTDVAMNCVNISNSELSCTGDGTSLRTSFTSVTFTCIGPFASASQVTYPDATSSCSGNFEEVVVSNVVALGLLCESSGEFFYYYGDYALECAERAHNFEYGGTLYGFEFAHYVCSESATFAVGSTSTQGIRNVTLGVEASWIKNTNGCFELLAAPTSPTVPFTNAPIIAPTSAITTSPMTATAPGPTAITITESPILAVTTNPATTSAAPIIAATSAPMVTATSAPIFAAPVSAPVLTSDDTQRSSSSNSSDSSSSLLGIAIGGAVGGVALVAVIGMFLLVRERRKHSGYGGGGGTGSNHKASPIAPYSGPPYPTESNTDDDFTPSPPRRNTKPSSGSSSRSNGINSVTASLVQPSSAFSQPHSGMLPIPETPSNQYRHHRQQSAEKNVEPDNTYNNSYNNPMHSSNTAQHTAASSSPRSSHPPNNHILNVKDQCRSVAVVRSSSPTLISYPSESQIPFAVALGVNRSSSTANTTPTTATTAMASVTTTSSTHSSSQNSSHGYNNNQNPIQLQPKPRQEPSGGRRTSVDP